MQELVNWPPGCVAVKNFWNASDLCLLYLQGKKQEGDEEQVWEVKKKNKTKQEVVILTHTNPSNYSVWNYTPYILASY